MIIDSHCHLNYSPMSENLDEVIKRAKNNGVNYMLTISTEHKSFENVLSIIDNYKEVYGTYGIHPHEAKNHMGIKKDNIINSTKLNKKIIGIGETGLDFHYNHSEKNDQCELFEQHIYASQSTGLPLIIHSRNAEKETLEILEKNLKILGNNSNYEIIKNDFFSYFELKNASTLKFDIIFIDPPYKELRINEIVEIIRKQHLLNKEGIIIIHRHKKDNIKLSDETNILEKRNYGISNIFFIT